MSKVWYRAAGCFQHAGPEGADRARTGMVKMPPRLVAMTSSSASAVFPPTACSPGPTSAIFEETDGVHAELWLNVRADIALCRLSPGGLKGSLTGAHT